MDLPAPWPKAISLRDTLSAAQGFFCRGERPHLRTEELIIIRCGMGKRIGRDAFTVCARLFSM